MLLGPNDKKLDKNARSVNRRNGDTIEMAGQGQVSQTAVHFLVPLMDLLVLLLMA